MVFHVILRVNVVAVVISMERHAVNAKKVFIIIQHAKTVIAIQLVLLQNSPVVVQFQPVNYANAKNV